MPCEHTPAGHESPRGLRRVLWSSYLGTSIEFYDFALYTAMATLVLGPLFFGDLSPLVATVAALGTLAVGYIVRPLGAVVFGYLGDRYGRKTSLVLTMLVMGGATTAIGLLPTRAQIGETAPVLLILLRAVQGVGVGGEWGGAALMAFEHAPPRRRGFAGSVVNAGTPTGVVLASGVLALFLILPENDFATWGWRIPFLLSAVLVAFAIWIRLRLAESPVFEAEVRGQNTEVSPLVLVARNPRPAVLALLVALAPFAYNALVNSYALLWIVEGGGLARSQALLFQTVAALVNIPMALAFGALSDRAGRRRVIAIGMIGGVLYTGPFLYLLQTGNVGLTVLGYVVSVVFMGAMFGPISAFISELFDAKARYTGASLGYQLASTIGGIAPALFSALLATGIATAGRWVALIMAGLGAIGLIVLGQARPRTGIEGRDPRTEVVTR
jgi:MFS family permease